MFKKIKLGEKEHDLKFGMKAAWVVEQDYKINVYGFGDGSTRLSPDLALKVLYASLVDKGDISFTDFIDLVDVNYSFNDVNELMTDLLNKSNPNKPETVKKKIPSGK